jgi:hypothetical protein
MRIDNNNVRKLTSALSHRLQAAGLDGVMVDITLAPKLIGYSAGKTDVEEIAQFITYLSNSGSVFFNAPEISERFPKVAEMIDVVGILHLRGLNGVCVDLSWGLGGAVPLDGRWIEEGIDTKAKNYGDRKAVGDLMLVIGAPMFVDLRQIESFKKSHPDSEALPFSEIWITTCLYGTHLLKPHR